VCGIVTRSKRESLNSRAVSFRTRSALKRQLRFIRKTRRPVEVMRCPANVSPSCADSSVTAASAALLDLRKSRRSICGVGMYHRPPPDRHYVADKTRPTRTLIAPRPLHAGSSRDSYTAVGRRCPNGGPARSDVDADVFRHPAPLSQSNVQGEVRAKVAVHRSSFKMR